MPLTRDEVLDWPKAELHCHLDGSLRLSTLLELARDAGKTDMLPAPDEAGLARELERIDQSTTLEDYLEWFRYSIAVMQSMTPCA